MANTPSLKKAGHEVSFSFILQNSTGKALFLNLVRYSVYSSLTRNGNNGTIRTASPISLLVKGTQWLLISFLPVSYFILFHRLFELLRLVIALPDFRTTVRYPVWKAHKKLSNTFFK